MTLPPARRNQWVCVEEKVLPVGGMTWLTACAVIPREQASVTAGHRIVNSDKIAVRGYLVDVEAQIRVCPAQP